MAGRAEAVQGEHAAGEGEWGGPGANWGGEGMRHKVVVGGSPGGGGNWEEAVGSGVCGEERREAGGGLEGRSVVVAGRGGEKMGAYRRWETGCTLA